MQNVRGRSFTKETGSEADSSGKFPEAGSPSLRYDRGGFFESKSPGKLARKLPPEPGGD